MSLTARMLTLVAVLVGLAPVLIVSPAAAQRRPVIGVLSPFVDADSTFLNDLRDGLAAHGLRDGKEIATNTGPLAVVLKRCPNWPKNWSG